MILNDNFHDICFHFTLYLVGCYLIAGGETDGGAATEKTEVVELFESNSTLSYGNLPSTRSRAVGAMFGNAPILCGGYYGSSAALDSCILFQNSKWSQSHSLIVKRAFPAGVQINSTTFWILGGSYFTGSSYVYLDSTEFIIEGQTNGVPGPKLPYGLDSICAVKLAEEIFVIGGQDRNYNSRNEVWIYDPQNGFARNQGPSLNTGRYAHSCSTMRDGEKILIVTAGGYNGGKLDSVEIYDPTDKTWHSGKTNSEPKKIL